MRGYTTIYSDECFPAYTRHERHFISLLFQMDRVDKFSATSPSLDLPAGTIHVLHMHITCQFPSGFECQQPRIRKDKRPMHQKYANFRPKGMLILEVIFWNEEQSIYTQASADMLPFWPAAERQMHQNRRQERELKH